MGHAEEFLWGCYVSIPWRATEILSRVEFLTMYIISSAWRMISWADLASSRVGCDAHAGAHIQVQILFSTEHAVRKTSRNTACNHECGFFSSLRQQHDKFVATVAEGIVDQAQVRLDGVANLGEQLAADEMSVGIVHLLEVVEIEEEDAELVSETRRAVDLGFERLVEMTRVVESGAVVRDGQFLDAFHGARIIDGDGGVIGERL